MVNMKVLLINVLVGMLVLQLSSAKDYSKCEFKRAKANARTKCGFVGGEIPQCQKDGSYSPVQCSGSTGICCCANTETGVQNPSTCARAPKAPICGSVPKRYTKCELERAVATVRSKDCKFLGVSIPCCEKNGYFCPLQCRADDTCCCADVETGKLSNCVKPPRMPPCN